MKNKLMKSLNHYFLVPARVAELVDALDLGSSGISRRGSSPLSRTTSKINEHDKHGGILYFA